MTQDTKDALEMMNYSSVPIQGKIAGFTPLVDVIAEADGIVCAAVFGKVWRYCQMKDVVCKASTDTIAHGLGIDRSTVSRHLLTLCEKGYIKDLSPNVRNAPHVYVDTGKIRVHVSLTVAENTPTVAQRTPTVAESRMSKDSKRDSKKGNAASAANDLFPPRITPIPATPKRTVEQLKRSIAEHMERGLNGDSSLVSAIESEFHISPNWDTKTNRAILSRLRERGATPEQVEQVKRAWDATNGRNGYVPSVSQIAEFWPSAFIKPKQLETVTIYE